MGASVLCLRAAFVPEHLPTLPCRPRCRPRRRAGDIPHVDALRHARIPGPRDHPLQGPWEGSRLVRAPQTSRSQTPLYVMFAFSAQSSTPLSQPYAAVYSSLAALCSEPVPTLQPQPRTNPNSNPNPSYTFSLTRVLLCVGHRDASLHSEPPHSSLVLRDTLLL